MMNSKFNIISVVRCLHRPNGAVIGRLFINDQYFCDTLESENHLINLGSYDLDLNTISPKYSTNVFYKNLCGSKLPRIKDVPGRSGLLIHCGNFVKDTTGCILVGMYYPFYPSLNFIKESQKTFKKFYNKIKSFKYPIKIDISDINVY